MSQRICVVGAGAAGLTAIKACLEEGLEVVCYEKTRNVGGLWCYRSEDIAGVGRVQKTTIANSSKEINSFSDFPAPKEFANYMDHKKMFEYFSLYAKHFRLLPHIRFEHSIIKIDKTEDYDSTHRFKVSVQSHKDNDSVITEVFDGVMVCSGHHTTPRWPHFDGQHLFKGKIIHSRDIVSHWDLKEYEDKTAVVVGIGNSGCDSAVELSYVCDKTYISLRSGGWVLHRVGQNGWPIDYQFHTRFLHKLRSLFPFRLICWFYETFVYNNRFDHRLYGIEPNFGCFSEIPIVSDLLPVRMICGKIVAKKDIQRFVENGVIFVGDTDVTECDLVVMATGYDHSFPFVDKSLFDHSSNEALNLYKQIFPEQLSHSSLGFIGALQPNGGIFALFEMQSRLYALLMTGKCRLPSHDHIVADIALTKQRRDQVFYKSARNSLAVDWLSYMDDIADMIGVKPDIKQYLLSDTQLFIKLVFGPTLPYQYRLRGPHSWCGARDALMQSDYRVKYALNPNEAKNVSNFYLSANFYKCVFLLVLFLFVYFIIEIFD